MSSGPFVRSFYEAGGGGIHPIRLQPETLTVNGGAATGPTTSSISAKVGGSRRGFGLHARGMRLVRTVGTGDTAFNRYNFLPICTIAAYDGFDRGDTITYGGFTWTISDMVPERKR